MKLQRGKNYPIFGKLKHGNLQDHSPRRLF